MDRKIKVVQYGTGKMSVYTMRYVYEKGAEIVGAIDVNPDVIGKDIGEIIGCEEKGVKVVDVASAEKMLLETKPDAVIVTTMSLIKDVEEALMLCAKLGINAITTCEEAAKENNCTITGTGYQDIYWGELISAIGGSTHKITKIKGSSSYNVEDYGIALAKAHGAGLTLEEFDKEVASQDRISDEERQAVINSGEYQPSYMWNVNGWLCEKLGLTAESQTQECIPQIAKKDMFSKTLNMTIKEGMATGMSLETQCIGKVYDETEFDRNEWTIEGEPNTTIVVEKPATVELTCATVVNRIPDVINAKAGYVPTNEMDELKYRVKPLNEYVK